MILSCDCSHKYQDQKYGQGKRVHNSCSPSGSEKRYRCTVCKKERSGKESAKIVVAQPVNGKK